VIFSVLFNREPDLFGRSAFFSDGFIWVFVRIDQMHVRAYAAPAILVALHACRDQAHKLAVVTTYYLT
jgi:hypothetical protein